MKKHLLMTSEDVRINFTGGNFDCVSREKIYDTNLIAVDILTIKVDNHEFQFTETTLLGKGSRRVYSELVLVE